MRSNKLVFWGLGWIVLGFLGLGLYGILIEPYQVEIHHLWIENSPLGKILEGKTAVHLSDLHIGKIGRREQKVLKIVEDLEPDFVFLTGDYVEWRGDYEVALTFLAGLQAKIGTWAVMGDYDYSQSRKSCLFCHEAGSGKPTPRHEVRFLKNSFEQVNLPDGAFWIGGLDRDAELPFSSDRISLPEKVKEPAIILSHSPLAFDLLDEDQDVLILAGDTHGGQIPLPSWVWGILG